MNETTVTAETFDLLTTVESGGCSVKLAPGRLAEVLKDLRQPAHPDLLVDISTHDDAGVYRIDDETALIQTVDFFPPVCSDPREFGRIAAANALSDVYAMGGRVLTAMNIVCFPATRIPLEVLGEILAGGQEKVLEAGGLMVGGHTIDDWPPKYGLAVTGIVHPQRIIANAGLRPGLALILTKPLGTGTLIVGRRVGLAADADYRAALDAMQQLNRAGADVMQACDVRGGTDITGFGLLGHAMQMADASHVTLRIQASRVPLLAGAHALAAAGRLPGAMFRNLDYVEKKTHFAPGLDYSLKMLLLDPQTSGGLFFGVEPEKAQAALERLHDAGYAASAIVGQTVTRTGHSIEVLR
ncbi:MAG: selenide, water dikinase SelD [Rhodocyclaceae bacterium]|nr:selenide, water dikinase SelD [Rhodocyclaceae bacterium]